MYTNMIKLYNDKTFKVKFFKELLAIKVKSSLQQENILSKTLFNLKHK